MKLTNKKLIIILNILKFQVFVGDMLNKTM